MFSSYEQALHFWFSRVNYEQRTPQASDLNLDRIRALLRRLGDPQDRLRLVHVAGSKGKGSTSAMLAAILRAAGYRTGLFTSPHLCRVEERIQVDGACILPEELLVLLDDVRTALNRPGPPLEPTFFEIATALGFLHFVRRRVEAAVLEVGLGGRFDSTNVCRPAVAVITSISFDHVQQLGNRLASIAMEKAGIVKPGRPVISGATPPEARAVIEGICRERSAPLWQLGDKFRYDYQPARIQGSGVRGQGSGVRSQKSEVRSQKSEVRGQQPQGDWADSCLLTPEERPRVSVVTGERAWPAMELSLLGEHQAANAAVAIACVERLRGQGWHVPDSAVAAGLASVRWPARLEVVGRRPFVVLDCAHNDASVVALVETLQTSFPPGQRLLIFAASGDKDLSGMFRVLAPHFGHVFLTRYAGSTRGALPEHLAELWRGVTDIPFTLCDAADEAWRAAQRMAGPDDLICITGSVFLAGELRPLLVGETAERAAGFTSAVGP